MSEVKQLGLNLESVPHKHYSNRLLGNAISTASLIILFLDISLHLGAAVPVLYTGVLWIASNYPNKRALFITAILSTALIVIGMLLSPTGGAQIWVVVFNRVLCIFIVWLTFTFLAQRKQQDRTNLILSNIARTTSNSACLALTDGTIIWKNESFSLTFDQKAELENVKDIAKTQQVLEQIETGLSSDESIVVDMDITWLNERNTWVQVTSELINRTEANFPPLYLFLFVDITISKQFEESIPTYLHYVHTIIDNCNEPIIVTNEDLSVAFANQAALQMDEIAEPGEISYFLQALFSEHNEDSDLHEKWHLLKEGEIRDITTEVSSNDKLFLISAASITSPMSGEREFVISLIDITIYKKTQADLENANQELRQFTQIASHDLQEPLRKIASFLQIIEEDYAPDLPEEAREYIAFAVDGARRLKQLIQELLFYSGLGKSDKLEFTEIDPNEMMERLCVLLGEAIDSADAKVEHETLPSVLGNESLLQQLFQNIILNGIKYRSPERPPVIKVSASSGKRRVKFAIADNGMGMEKQYHQQIFKIFRRLHSKSEFPGTGIGLAVCQRIVELHGGKIWVESNPGIGSTFYFTLKRSNETRK